MNSYAVKRRKLNNIEEKSQSMLAEEPYDGEKQRNETEFHSATKMAALEDKPTSILNHVNPRSEQHQKHGDFSLLAGDMYTSSKFVLQLDEMLAEVRPDYEKRLAPMESVLRKLKDIIEQLPDVEPLSVCSHLIRLRYDSLKCH